MGNVTFTVHSFKVLKGVKTFKIQSDKNVKMYSVSEWFTLIRLFLN